jgi:small GTP-binding protein
MCYNSYKYILIGDPGVGKTSIVSKCTMNEFNETYNPTIGVDFGTKIARVEDRDYKLYIWDTAGNEIYKTITQSYYRNANCVILVYDITNRQSFINLPLWITNINNIVKDTLMILVGNKNDIGFKREVDYEEGYNAAKKNNMLFMELSARNYENVENLIYTCLKQLIYKHETHHSRNNNREYKNKITHDCCDMTYYDCCVIL